MNTKQIEQNQMGIYDPPTRVLNNCFSNNFLHIFKILVSQHKNLKDSISYVNVESHKGQS